MLNMIGWNFTLETYHTEEFHVQLLRAHTALFQTHDDQMETFSALLAICEGNSPITGEFPAPRPVARSFDVCFDLRLNKRLSNHREAGDLIRYLAHYDVVVMSK